MGKAKDADLILKLYDLRREKPCATHATGFSVSTPNPHRISWKC